MQGRRARCKKGQMDFDSVGWERDRRKEEREQRSRLESPAVLE